MKRQWGENCENFGQISDNGRVYAVAYNQHPLYLLNYFKITCFIRILITIVMISN